jgi:hypothetical protein
VRLERLALAQPRGQLPAGGNLRRPLGQLEVVQLRGDLSRSFRNSCSSTRFWRAFRRWVATGPAMTMEVKNLVGKVEADRLTT